jgi:hypothetical protein
MEIKTLLKNKWLIGAMSVAVLATMCSAITHEYGPYYGKVIDAETKEPLEGAVIVLVFYTERFGSPGGRVSHLADAMEAVTDKKGDFKIPAIRFFRYRIMSVWRSAPLITIIKSGYGCFPDHKKSSIGIKDVQKEEASSILLPNRELIVMLPKIDDPKERRENLTWNCNLTVSYDTVPTYKNEENKERVHFGLEPLSGGKK